MTQPKTDPSALTREVLQAFDALNGSQPGYRPAHAKGVLISGHFTPSPAARSLTRAPHIERDSTPVTVRFSNASGMPVIADTDPNASPRGVAIRFHLADHIHTDIIGHSVDGFPVRTVEEFLEFLRAVYTSGPAVPSPKPIETFLATHPAALAFVQSPKPLPTSFLRESFYAVNAHRFIDAAGTGRFGRYRIRPDGDNQYFDGATASGLAPDFLFDEIRERLGKGPAKMRIAVQLASAEDVVNDATAHWPAGRPEVEFGVVELASVLPNDEAEQKHIIFDPIPRVDGIEASDDPLLEPRAAIYLSSGRRRRGETKDAFRSAS